MRSMKLKIFFHGIEDEEFSIKINDSIFKIDSISSQCVIDIPNIGIYEMSITQIKEKLFPTSIEIIFMLVTLLIQGIFNVLTMNIDIDSVHNIKPVLISAKSLINLEDDTSIHFNIKYNSNKGFLIPVLKSENINLAETKYTIYWNAFKDYFYKYTRKVISVNSLWLCLMLFLILEMVKIKHFIGLYICLILGVGSILLNCFLILKRLKTKKKLQKQFVELLEEMKETQGDGSIVSTK